MARVESTTGWFKCVLGACLALATLASPGALALAEAPATTRAGRPRGVPDRAPVGYRLDRKGYVAEGSVVVIRPNLTGAKYTLAVPAYTFAAGLRTFADIARFALRYLAGGDAVFGPDSGGAAVYTNTRAGYSRQCPNKGSCFVHCFGCTGMALDLAAAVWSWILGRVRSLPGAKRGAAGGTRRAYRSSECPPV